VWNISVICLRDNNGSWKLIFSDSDEQHSFLRFWRRPHNVLTYLLGLVTYLQWIINIKEDRKVEWDALPFFTQRNPVTHEIIHLTQTCRWRKFKTSSTAVGINWMCRPAKSTDVGEPAQLRLPGAHSVEQFAISTAWQQPVTEHVQEAAEDSSVWIVMNATRRRCGVSLWFWRRI